MTFPDPNIDTFDQPLIDAYWTKGWTSQNLAYLPAPSPTNPPGAPPVTRVNITHAYFDGDGSPLAGFVTFMPSSSANITVNGTTWRIPARLSGTTTVSPFSSGWGWRDESSGKIHLYKGLLGVTLMQTDATGLVVDNGQALTYLVTEHFDGGRQFSISVPGASSNPVDLDSLMVSGTLVPYVYDPTNVLATELVPTINYSALNPTPDTFGMTFTNQTVVTVNHNLHAYPTVIVTDTSGNVVQANVQYTSNNQVVVTFAQPFSGTIVCDA